MGQFRWRSRAMWLRILSLWLACSWESHPLSNHVIKPGGPEGSEVSRGLSAFGSGRACIAFPSSLHCSRVSSQERLHSVLAYTLPHGIWRVGPCVLSCPNLSAWQVLAALHHRGNPTDSVLLHPPSACFWRKIRVSPFNVYELVLGNWSGGKLDGISCCIFYIIAHKIPVSK